MKNKKAGFALSFSIILVAIAGCCFSIKMFDSIIAGLAAGLASLGIFAICIASLRTSKDAPLSESLNLVVPCIAPAAIGAISMDQSI
ncbi:MAG TPA: hypothetical protein PLM35_13405, partial [Cyclobacteriaceae bacterium]|nr:hypothetical protein [Cyclobacteriaceae bacterium]